MKKAIIKLLAGLLAVSLVSGCGAGVSQKTPEKQILKWALSNMNYDMTPYEEVLNEKLEEKGLRDKVKVMIGGSPISQKYADEIGADGYSVNAVEAVKLAKRLLNIA